MLDRCIASFATAGKILVMSVTAIFSILTDIPRGRFPWPEFIRQAWFMTGVAVVPTILVAIPFGVIISVQVSSLAQQVGATSFLGAATGLGVIQQGAPIVTALLLAGAVGSAITSDLGARTIREEIAALEVLGISPVRRMVAPRLLAIVVVALVLCSIVVFTGVITGYLFNVLVQSGTPGSYVSSFAAFATPTDLVLAEVKSALFGAIVGVVAAHKGLSASGGPGGVAQAVNAAVVLAVVTLFGVNVIISQLAAVLLPGKLG
ncbi:ABC transporter permease [Pseudonocardiaceae bacterium YIM PH 21723]|nr:ABC transporter permease [Pseudonocardiaceae bacterium YIM PH 21723]